MIIKPKALPGDTVWVVDYWNRCRKAKVDKLTILVYSKQESEENPQYMYQLVYGENYGNFDQIYSSESEAKQESKRMLKEYSEKLKKEKEEEYLRAKKIVEKYENKVEIT